MSLPLIRSQLLGGIEGIQHGFTTRIGGVSTGQFSSLNCSPFSGDDNKAIEENRRLISSELGAHALVTNRQMHGTRVRIIDSDSDLDLEIEADAIVTRKKGICIAALGADCAPVLFADPQHKIIGAAHVGWRGALDGVVDAIVGKLEQLGAERSTIHCCIGPAIQQKSYEVGEDFRSGLMALSTCGLDSCFRVNTDTGNVHFDLPKYIETRLEDQGLELIDRREEDTYSDEERFFSYRRACHQGESLYGRQVGAICLS
jgi:YfiH family protein